MICPTLVRLIFIWFTWYIECYFVIKGTLAWNRLKSLILTTPEVLINIYRVWNHLDFKIRTQLIIVHIVEIFPKLFSFAILYFCIFFKMLEIASMTIKKASVWRFAIYSWWNGEHLVTEQYNFIY